MIRIFTAFPIRNEIADSFLQISKTNSHIQHIRWTPKDNLHITLFFIGEVEENNLNEIQNKLTEFLPKQKAFTLEFESIIVKGKKDSMLWAQFKRNESFSALSEAIYQQVKQFMTIKRNHEDPVPHCTVARMKPNADIFSIDKNIEATNQAILVDHAEIWKTVQSKEGVKYESLGKFLMNN